VEKYTAWANVPANLKTKTQLTKEGLKTEDRTIADGLA
jgi:hypothetical protein